MTTSTVERTTEAGADRHSDAQALDAAVQEQLRRRSAMRRFGMKAAGAAAALAAGVATAAKPAAAQSAPTDTDIGNFALNLEHLEAEFYLRAATGSGLSGGDITGNGPQGGVTGGSQVPFRSTAIAQYAQVLAVDELAHVRFLRAVLGNNAIARPQIDLQASFTTLAVAAGLIVPGQTFNPFADDVSFLLGSYIFEDVGVTAYAGAARNLTDPNIIEAASSILAVEAYHAGAIRGLIANIGGGQAANAISNLRATLSGRADDQGILIQGNNFNFASGDYNGLVFRRTTRQVLNIVFGAAGARNGLFFPNGVNGTILS